MAKNDDPAYTKLNELEARISSLEKIVSPSKITLESPNKEIKVVLEAGDTTAEMSIDSKDFKSGITTNYSVAEPFTGFMVEYKRVESPVCPATFICDINGVTHVYGSFINKERELVVVGVPFGE